jgi:hypothetical protein
MRSKIPNNEMWKIWEAAVMDECLGYIQEFWYSSLENHENNIKVAGLWADT